MAGGVLVIAAILGAVHRPADAQPTKPAPAARRVGVDKVMLEPDQLQEFKVGPVMSRDFVARADAVGVIDFNQDRSVQAFSPYQGRIGNVLVKPGDEVRAGQVLYTVQIPDLAQAGASLISTGGALRAANETLRRAQKLFDEQSIAQKELQQNIADQQAADANHRAARKTLGLFGLSPQEIDAMEASRRVDTEMPVRSPFAGRIVARAGAPGQLVQPGAGTAPVTVADMHSVWMVASVPESEIGAWRIGEQMRVQVPAYPGRNFAGHVSYISEAADAATRRFTVRAQVGNEDGLLRPQMSATFVVQTGAPQNSPAVPENALAREGDGGTSAWVTRDGRTFQRRVVQTGLIQEGQVQVLAGLSPGERIAQDKALFLSNLYQTSNSAE